MTQLSTTKKKEFLLELNQYLVTFCQEFAPVILKIPRVYYSGDYLFKTDGKVIKIGDKFFDLKVQEQLFKALQISMHVALRHPIRARDIYHNQLALSIWNVATDLVINNAIRDYIQIKLKDDNQSLESEFTLRVLDMLTFNIPDFNLDELNAEQVFERILRYTDTQNISISPDQMKAVQSLLDKLDQVENEFTPQDFNDSSDILKDNGLDSEDSDNSDSQDLIWSKRVDSVIDKIAGTLKGTNILKLKKELPKVKVDWTKILRDFLTSRLLPEKEPNWKRPSRRVTAGISEFFEPYRDRKKGLRKLALCWDVSGSCFDDKTIAKFVANIEAVHSITSCELIVIPFDTEVIEDSCVKLHCQQKLSDLIKDGKLHLEAGGGTDFRPPIDYAVKQSPDVIVILTDCYGPFPEPCKIPTIWATTGDNAPWGKNLFIGEEKSV